MEDNKDHIGAAVRALPSDLTEREQIDLLCHVETYMSITDKHSQTAPEAMAEETRMYSLVNGLIAKRFSNIGAAVRGEAVAECREDGRCQYAIDHGAEGMGHCPVDKCCMPVSARAADAPSDLPTEILAKVMTRDDFNCSTELGYAQFLAWSIWLKSYRAVSPDFNIMDNLKGVLSQIDNMVCGKSRAADALDSQPQPASQSIGEDALIATVTAHCNDLADCAFALQEHGGFATTAQEILVAVTELRKACKDSRASAAPLTRIAELEEQLAECVALSQKWPSAAGEADGRAHKAREAALDEAAGICMRATPDRDHVRRIGEAAHYVACSNAILRLKKIPAPQQEGSEAGNDASLKPKAEQSMCVKGEIQPFRTACQK